MDFELKLRTPPLITLQVLYPTDFMCLMKFNKKEMYVVFVVYYTCRIFCYLSAE